MRHFNVRMPLHPFTAELEYGRVCKGLGNDDRGGYATFFKFYGVVHTAQRARPSSTHSRNRDIHLFCHFVDQIISRRL